MINPEDLAVILTMDHFIISMCDNAYATEHRMRDAAIEFGLTDTKQTLTLEHIIFDKMNSKEVPAEMKYKLFGLWLIGSVRLNEEKSTIELTKEAEKAVEEDDEEEPVVKLPPEDPKERENKLRRYCT